MKHRTLWPSVIGLLALIFQGCGGSDAGAKEGTDNAEQCVQSDLIAQCPPGTEPDLTSNAAAVCSMSGSIDVSQGTDNLQGGAAVESACVGSGLCKVVCRLVERCPYGVKSINPETGIICADPPEGCGNNACDPGETPTSCPIDCGNQCEPGITRCSGDQLQACSPRGVWDGGIDCPTGQRCTNTGGIAACGLSSCGDGILDDGEECDPALDDEANCDVNCTRPRCGNGVRGLDVRGDQEECDDGNTDNTDNCTNICENSRCGDGYIQAGEECDDGNEVDTDGCRNNCILPVCGDGVVQGNETCDDGNQNDSDTCNNECRSVRCGDGILQQETGEECDDGNDVDTDNCLNNCRLPQCGDGVIQDGVEECDDFNMIDTDACTNACRNAVCGDGAIQRGVEECDDNNGDETDGCTNDCTEARCGDGIVHAGVEACDDENVDNDDACTNACELPICGDGFTWAEQEACDDGNELPDDACTDTCQVAICGDGIQRTDLPQGHPEFEQCDLGIDGDPRDGCTDECTMAEVEPNNTTRQADARFSEGQNIILYGSISGVMEAARDDENPGIDAFQVIHDCGVEDGQDCPDGRNMTWNIALRAYARVACNENNNGGGGRPGQPGRDPIPMPIESCQDRVLRAVTVECSSGVCRQPELTWSDSPLGLRDPISIARWEVIATTQGAYQFQLLNAGDTSFDYEIEVDSQ